MYQSFWVQAYFRYIHLKCIRITGQVENNNKTHFTKKAMFSKTIKSVQTSLCHYNRHLKMGPQHNNALR